MRNIIKQILKEDIQFKKYKFNNRIADSLMERTKIGLKYRRILVPYYKLDLDLEDYMYSSYPKFQKIFNEYMKNYFGITDQEDLDSIFDIYRTKIKDYYSKNKNQNNS